MELKGTLQEVLEIWPPLLVVDTADRRRLLFTSSETRARGAGGPVALQDLPIGLPLSLLVDEEVVQAIEVLAPSLAPSEDERSGILQAIFETWPLRLRLGDGEETFDVLVSPQTRFEGEIDSGDLRVGDHLTVGTTGMGTRPARWIRRR